MLLRITAILAETSMSLSEKTRFGLEFLLLCLAVVFMSLIIVWLALAIRRRISKNSDNKKEAQTIKEENAFTVPQNIPVQIAAPQAVSPLNNSEIAAVIAAAISAYTNKEIASFRVVSFKER